MVDGAWPVVQGSWPRGPALPRGPGMRQAQAPTWGRAPGPLGRASPLGHELCAMSHEPLTIYNRLISLSYDYCLLAKSWVGTLGQSATANITNSACSRFYYPRNTSPILIIKG